ncbi:MAG: hypothetical protein OEZ01_10020, partial [Candidatus Heimdallarchaeota archaeon]|nr:hypothetical protein [Candidatus Heimdallarchaeota archaeon]
MEIRTFDPSYIESQVELGKNVTKNWKTFTQTSSEQLKRSYTNENFDPETRLYAFKDNQLVGFLTSSVNKQTGTAGFRFPLVAEGHEDCASPLIVKALDVLK